jgi:hypothetical protein
MLCFPIRVSKGFVLDSFHHFRFHCLLLSQILILIIINEGQIKSNNIKIDLQLIDARLVEDVPPPVGGGEMPQHEEVVLAEGARDVLRREETVVGRLGGEDLAQAALYPLDQLKEEFVAFTLENLNFS